MSSSGSSSLGTTLILHRSQSSSPQSHSEGARISTTETVTCKSHRTSIKVALVDRAVHYSCKVVVLHQESYIERRKLRDARRAYLPGQRHAIDRQPRWRDDRKRACYECLHLVRLVPQRAIERLEVRKFWLGAHRTPIDDGMFYAEWAHSLDGDRTQRLRAVNCGRIARARRCGWRGG